MFRGGNSLPPSIQAGSSLIVPRFSNSRSFPVYILKALTPHHFLMRKVIGFLFCLIPALCFAQVQTLTVQYSPVDFIHYTPVASQVQMTPLWNYTSDGGTNLVTGATRNFSTGTIIDSQGRTHVGIPGTLIVSNVLIGAYRVEMFLPLQPRPVSTFTNVFTNGSPSFVNGGTGYFGVATNQTLKDEFAYTMSEIDAMFANIGGGNGITLATATNVLNGAGGVIQTNGSGSTFKFSTTGTNAIEAIGDARYDPISTALAREAAFEAFTNTLATSAFGNASGLSSGTVSTSRLGSGTANSGTYLRGDQTWQPVSGAGTVTSVALSGPADLTISGSPVTGSGTLSFSRTAGALADYNGQNISNLNSIVVGSGSITNTSLTASTLLKADANKKTASLANGIGVLTNDLSGNMGFSGAPLIDGSALKASQFVTTDASTNLQSTLNAKAFGLTNLSSYFTNYGTVTNIVLPADGNNWTVLATNGPHQFYSFAGDNIGDISIWITTNGDHTLPPSVTMLGYSNNLNTNCILDFKRWGGTNRVLGGQSEL